jgi:hypothetical protein
MIPLVVISPNSAFEVLGGSILHQGVWELVAGDTSRERVEHVFAEIFAGCWPEQSVVFNVFGKVEIAFLLAVYIGDDESGI